MDHPSILFLCHSTQDVIGTLANGLSYMADFLENQTKEQHLRGTFRVCSGTRSRNFGSLEELILFLNDSLECIQE